jgi:hypothetical protein
MGRGDQRSYVVSLLISLADSFGRRLGTAAAELMAESVPDVPLAVLKDAGRRYLKEHDRFILRNFLQLVDEVCGDREVPSSPCPDTAAALDRIRRELDIPEEQDEAEGAAG